MTKVFFVPIAAGGFGFLLVWAWRRGGRAAASSTLVRLTLVMVVAASTAGWWYVRNWWEYGVVFGAAETVELETAGGLLAGLAGRFTLPAWVWGHGVTVATAAWSATWSLAQPPYPFRLPLVFLAVWVGVAYVAALARLRLTIAWIPAWLFAPLAVALSYHVLVRIALTGEARAAPGYYVHILAGPLGVALGLGLGTWWRHSAFRRGMAALMAYALVFAAAISVMQVLLFGGWLFKAGESKFYQAPAALPILSALPEALVRLRVLAYPILGAAAWVGGGTIVLVGLAAGWKAARGLPRP